jgi:hypothetical protein
MPTPAGHGSLVVVGTGIKYSQQTTPEARQRIKWAEKVLYLCPEPLSARWMQELNPSAASLGVFYAPDRPRVEAYKAMAEEILSWVRKGLAVCAAFYGHPGVFVDPSHEAIMRAREEGFPARMLPGVSSEDCLIADLGLDPGDRGLQSFEATNFLLFTRTIDPTIPLLLWQVSVVGEWLGPVAINRDGLRILAERLVRSYPPDHEVVLYEASPYLVAEPFVERVRVKDLADAEVTPLCSLYVPPAGEPPRDQEMFDRLNAPRSLSTGRAGRRARGLA